MTSVMEAAPSAQGAPEADRSLAERLDIVVSRLGGAIHRALAVQAGEHRLSAPQLRCLQAMAASQSSLTTQLARELAVAVPTMTGRIDGLVGRGLVERHPATEDRRQIHLVLTAAGRAELERGQGAALARLQRLVDQLPEDQRERLDAALRDLLAALHAQEAWGVPAVRRQHAAG